MTSKTIKSGFSFSAVIIASFTVAAVSTVSKPASLKISDTISANLAHRLQARLWSQETLILAVRPADGLLPLCRCRLALNAQAVGSPKLYCSRLWTFHMPTWRYLAAASSGPGSCRAFAACSGVMPTPSSVRWMSTSPFAVSRSTRSVTSPALPFAQCRGRSRSRRGAAK